MIWSTLVSETAPLGLVEADPCLCAVTFLDGEYKEKDVEMLAWKTVKGSYPDTEHVQFRTLPEVTVASCTFRGSCSGSIRCTGGSRSSRDRNGAGGRPSGRYAGQESARRHVLFFSVSGRTAVRAGRSAGEGGRYPLHHRGDEDHERDQGTVRRQGHPHYGAAGRYGGV